MHRTQVYLTDFEHKMLASLASKTGKSQSQLLRDAVDQLISNTAVADRTKDFSQAKGIWKNHKDLPDINKLRKEFDRF